MEVCGQIFFYCSSPHLQLLFMLERETTVLRLRLCKIPCILVSSSQISVFPLRVAIHHSGPGTMVKGWTVECIVQPSYSFAVRLCKLSYLLLSIGSLCPFLIIMSSNCFIFTQAGFQSCSDLTVCAVIYIWIVMMLNSLYWLLIPVTCKEQTQPCRQRERSFFSKHIARIWVKANSL